MTTDAESLSPVDGIEAVKAQVADWKLAESILRKLMTSDDIHPALFRANNGSFFLEVGLEGESVNDLTDAEADYLTRLESKHRSVGDGVCRIP